MRKLDGISALDECGCENTNDGCGNDELVEDEKACGCEEPSELVECGGGCNDEGCDDGIALAAFGGRRRFAAALAGACFKSTTDGKTIHDVGGLKYAISAA